jgi:hypothetical protein
MLENNDVPQETSKNPVSVGRVGSVEDYSYSFYNPHNARFYFKFNKWNFKPDMTLFKVINSRELSIEVFDCRFTVKKQLIEVVNKINTERRFKVEGSIDNRREAIIKAVALLEQESINALKSFISRFGGASDFVCVKSHVPDNKILHDKIVDSVPDEVTFRNDVVKKVYKDLPKNVEVSTPEGASKTFRNLALFDFAPEISSKLSEIQDERLEFSKALALYTEQINLHLKVEQRQLEVQEQLLKTFKQNRVKQLKQEWGW